MPHAFACLHHDHDTHKPTQVLVEKVLLAQAFACVPLSYEERKTWARRTSNLQGAARGKPLLRGVRQAR
jgi:hypothetical protein